MTIARFQTGRPFVNPSNLVFVGSRKECCGRGCVAGILREDCLAGVIVEPSRLKLLIGQ